MEIQSVIMSILIYMLLINASITFRLSIAQNLTALMIILVSILCIGNVIGSLGVVPMLAALIFYIGWLKKEDSVLNIFLVLLCYALMVILDNIIHIVWNMLGIGIKSGWPFYMIINFPLAYILCRFCSKKAVNLRNRVAATLNPKIIRVLVVDILLCLFIFGIHITISDQAGSPTPLLICSIVLYIAYFALTAFMVVAVVKEYDANAKIMLKQDSYDNLQEYMVQIERFYQNLRTFKHDYSNIMVSMAGYIESGDMEGIKRYYEKEIFPIGNRLNKENDVIAKLGNLHIVELKSLMAVKISYALELNIKVSLDIPEGIEDMGMENIDLVRILGILLDNAVEACRECEEPSIRLGMVKEGGVAMVIIKNNYIKKDIDYSKLGSIGLSSKGRRRGMGLYNIKMITDSYDNVVMDTEYGDGYFTQCLEIYPKE